MATMIIRPQGRDEWLRLRGQGIGSSEVASILGLNPYETPYQLWRKKKGLDGPTPENFAMRAGHYLEDAVSLFYSDATGKEIIKASAGDWLVINPEKPWFRVSPDRTYWIPGCPKTNSNKGILECKTTQMMVDAESLPQHWFCQLQYQLGVAELEQGAIAWLTMGREFGYRDLAFDKEFFDYMAEEVERFWRDCILGNLEPQAINVADVLLKSPLHVAGKAIEADEELIHRLAELKELREEEKALKLRKEEIEEEVKMAMNDAESITSRGQVLATWKASKEGQKFNEKLFASEHPDTYNQYLITRPGTRRFNLK